MAKGKAREVQPHYRQCDRLTIYFQDYHHIYLAEGINNFRVTPLFQQQAVIRNWRHMWDMLHCRKPMDMTIALKTIRDAGYMAFGVSHIPNFKNSRQAVAGAKGKEWSYR